MAKNPNVVDETTAHAASAEELLGAPSDLGDTDQDGGENALADFDLDSDVKATPVLVAGTYTGHITETKCDLKNALLILTITMEDTGGVLSDGITPVGGSQFAYRIFLPKATDKGQMTKSGKETKWQWKVNNLAKSLQALGIAAKNPADIMKCVANQEWLGIHVRCELTTDEYNGALQNNAKKVSVIV